MWLARPFGERIPRLRATFKSEAVEHPGGSPHIDPSRRRHIARAAAGRTGPDFDPPTECPPGIDNAKTLVRNLRSRERARTRASRSMSEVPPADVHTIWQGLPGKLMVRSPRPQ